VLAEQIDDIIDEIIEKQAAKKQTEIKKKKRFANYGFVGKFKFCQKLFQIFFEGIKIFLIVL